MSNPPGDSKEQGDKTEPAAADGSGATRRIDQLTEALRLVEAYRRALYNLRLAFNLALNASTTADPATGLQAAKTIAEFGKSTTESFVALRTFAEVTLHRELRESLFTIDPLPVSALPARRLLGDSYPRFDESLCNDRITDATNLLKAVQDVEDYLEAEIEKDRQKDGVRRPDEMKGQAMESTSQEDSGTSPFVLPAGPKWPSYVEASVGALMFPHATYRSMNDYLYYHNAKTGHMPFAVNRDGEVVPRAFYDATEGPPYGLDDLRKRIRTVLRTVKDAAREGIDCPNALQDFCDWTYECAANSSGRDQRIPPPPCRTGNPHADLSSLVDRWCVEASRIQREPYEGGAPVSRKWIVGVADKADRFLAEPKTKKAARETVVEWARAVQRKQAESDEWRNRKWEYLQKAMNDKNLTDKSKCPGCPEYVWLPESAHPGHEGFKGAWAPNEFHSRNAPEVFYDLLPLGDRVLTTEEKTVLIVALHDKGVRRDEQKVIGRGDEPRIVEADIGRSWDSHGYDRLDKPEMLHYLRLCWGLSLSDGGGGFLLHERDQAVVEGFLPVVEEWLRQKAKQGSSENVASASGEEPDEQKPRELTSALSVGPGSDDAPSREVEWDNNAEGYLAASDALKLIDNTMSLPSLSKVLKPDGTIRYMRKGQRCRVHIRDFQRYAETTLNREVTDEGIERYLKGVEQRKEEARRKKTR